MKCFRNILFVLIFAFPKHVYAHEITFGGEIIPTERDFVATKLMTIIRQQIPSATLSYLKYQSQRYFPYISAWLKYYKIPDDFKYIPIVESGFQNFTHSKAGAAGFWQLMPATAREQGLVVNSLIDQRMDPYRSMHAACRVILQHRADLKKNLSRSSWVLTAASYNFGPGNVIKAVKAQGGDYFGMKLNDETAEYVYRLIAVKELFERPEKYMNGFGVNIFSKENVNAEVTDTAYHSIPESRRGAELGESGNELNNLTVQPEPPVKQPGKSFLIAATTFRPEKHFKDGGFLTFKLLGELQIPDQSLSAGSIIKGQAWLIDGRIVVDFGVGSDIELHDSRTQRGISQKDAQRDGSFVLLKTLRPSD